MARTAWICGAILPLALAACAPGDMQLSKADVAARAGGTVLHETRRSRVPEGAAVTYQLSCLHGTAIRDGSAAIAGVTGRPGRFEDYSLTPAIDRRGNRMTAVVRYIGPRVGGPAPMVIVDFTASCVPPVKRS